MHTPRDDQLQYPKGTSNVTPEAFPYRLAAIDIDDTLVGRDKQISPENRESVRTLQSLGCRIILATGRRHANALSNARHLGLEDFVVSTQGARAEHTGTGEVIHAATLNPHDARALIEEGITRGFTILLWLKDEIVAQGAERWIEHYYEETHDDPVTPADPLAYLDQPAEKVVWLDETAPLFAAQQEILPQSAGRFNALMTTNHSLEFAAPHANKDIGVAAVARYYQIPRDAVLAFGDGNNDASMLAWAGLGVAMAHGRPSAHAAAKLIAEEGDHRSALARGIAGVIQRCGLAVA